MLNLIFKLDTKVRNLSFHDFSVLQYWITNRRECVGFNLIFSDSRRASPTHLAIIRDTEVPLETAGLISRIDAPIQALLGDTRKMVPGGASRGINILIIVRL